MTQLTKEYLDEVLKTLTTKKDLEGLATAETLDKVAATVAGLVTDAKQLTSDIRSIRETMDSHTNILDGITKNTEVWTAESAALRSALNRHEQWIHQIAKKLGLELES